MGVVVIDLTDEFLRRQRILHGDVAGRHTQADHTPKKYGEAELVYYDPDEMGHLNDPWDVADEAGIYVSSDKEVAQVAIEDGNIVGALFEAVDYPNMIYSADIAVLPEHQGRGIGSQLADATVENFRDYQAEFEDLTMELDAINPVAVEMMERRGAEIIGQTEHHIQMRMKHMAGRHDQSRHDPHKGRGTYVETEDWRGDKVEYRVAHGPFDSGAQAARYGIDNLSFAEHKNLLAVEDANTGEFYLGDISSKRKAGVVESRFDDNWGTVTTEGVPVTAYHATSQEAVGAIREQGIKAHVSGAKIPAVYFTSDEESARVYGEAHGDNFAIIEFDIPSEKRNDVIFDDFDASRYGAENSYYIAEDVPPLWIKAVHVYEVETEYSMPRKVRTVKESSHYTVVVID